MANEFVLQVRTHNPINFVVADGTLIPKGTLLKITDGMTAIISSGQHDKLAGVAARDKVADDGRTSLAVFRQGIFLAFVSGSASAGDPVSAPATNTYPNFITAVSNATASGASMIGTMLADATNGEQKLMELNVGTGNRGIS